MDDKPNISIDELLRALNKKAIPLQPEIGAYIALETCAAIAERMIPVTGRDVWIDQQGKVSINSDKEPVSSEQAAAAIVDLLCELLLSSAHGIPPLLLELIDDQTRGAKRTVNQLHDQLEASLIPLNRGASQRVLARLMREVFREGERVSYAPPSSAGYQELDSRFDELLAEGGAPVKKEESGDSGR